MQTCVVAGHFYTHARLCRAAIRDRVWQQIRDRHVLKGLIKPDLNSRNPADRLTAIEKMSEPQQFQAELAAAVQNDSAAEVRLAALAKLTDTSKLAVLVNEFIDSPAANAADGDLKAAVQKQFIAALQDETQSPAAVQEWLDKSAECCHLVACAAPDESVRAAALARISDENGLVRVVEDAQHHSARHAAAERITQPEHLQTCLTKIKNRDKVTARLLQQRLGEHHAGIEKNELHQASVRQITGSMENLSKSVWSPQYAGQFTALQQRWKALDPVPGSDEQQAFTKASEAASKRVEEHKAQLQQLGACEETLGTIDKAIATLGEAKLASLPDTVKSVSRVADGLPQQWQAASASLTGENTLQPTYEISLKKLQGLLQHAQAVVKVEFAMTKQAADTKDSNAPVESPAAESAISTEASQIAETSPVSEASSGAEATETEESTAASESVENITESNSEATADPSTESNSESTSESTTTDSTEAKTETATAVPAKAQAKTTAPKKAGISPVKRRKVIDAALADDNFAATMSCVAELRERLGSVSELLEKDQHRQAQLVEGVGKQINALAATITAGKWGPAEGMSNRIVRKLEQIEGKSRQPLQGRYDAQRKKLDELADWQDFAAKPKLEELIKTMQELPAKSIKPRELADEVKSLQEQWKTLGGCRVANQLWPDFKEAGDTAYAPCKEYFDGLKKQREARIKNRKNVCERLEKYVEENVPGGLAPVTDTAGAKSEVAVAETPDEKPASAEAAVEASGEDTAASSSAEASDVSLQAVEPVGDWKAMQRMLTDANREWRNNRISGRKQDKQLESRFEKAVQQIEQLIAPHFVAGETERQELIERARKLSEGEINQHAINQAKSLQAAWKVCGPASRKNDRKLWNEFNELNGKIFGKHREDQQAQYKAGMAHVDRGREIVKAIRALGRKTSDQEDKQFQELQDEFQGLAEFPEKVRRGLVRDFRSACDGYNNKRSDLGKKQEREEINALRKLAVICEQIETGVIDYRDMEEPAVKQTETAAQSETEPDAATAADTKAPSETVSEATGPAIDNSDSAESAESGTESAGVAAKSPAAESSQDNSTESESPEPESKEQSADRADSESWLEQWQELGAVVPKPWLKRVQKRRDNAMAVLAKQDSPFSDENNDARRLHCIKLEILRDIETPAEDKAKRMQYQLEQLQSGPDSALKDSGKEQLRNYEVEWLCLPPASVAIAATLEQRFRNALGRKSGA